MPPSSEPLRCPACNARLRGEPSCSRCGTDLVALLRLAVEAHRQQLACWRALLGGEIDRAAAHARAAQRTKHSDAFAPTALLAALLSELDDASDRARRTD